MEDTDIIKMLEQANSMKNLFNSDENTSENDSEDNMTQMIQMIKMMSVFNTKKDEKSEIKKKHTNENIQNKRKAEIDIVSSAIPYLDHNHQKNLSVIIKIIELQEIFNFYNNTTVSIQSTNTDKDWKSGILSSIRPHVSKKKQELIDTSIQMLSIKKILDEDDNIEF
jgi:hypothetical protein